MKFKTDIVNIFRKLSGIVIICMAGMPGFANSQELKVGYFELPPRAYLGKTGDAEGPAVERFKLIAGKMGVKAVTFVQFPFARLLLELERGNIDAALVLGKSPERDAKFYYPTRPFYLVQSGLIIRTDSPLTEIKSSEDIKPLLVGVMLGSNLSPSMRADDIRKEFLSGEAAEVRNIEKLLLKRIDAVYTPDMYVTFYNIKTRGVDKEARVLALPDPPTLIYTVFTKEQGEVFGQKYVKALEAVNKEHGEYGKAPLK